MLDNLNMVHSTRILKMIQSNGEYDKILQGIYEHYLLCKITDIGATGGVKSKLDQVSDWLDFYLNLDHFVNANQQYECMGYMAYPLLKLHYLFGSPNKRFRIEYPRASYQVFSHLMKEFHCFEK
jgi:chromosome transmission fidelity protein 18